MCRNGQTKKMHYCLDCEQFYNPVNIERHKQQLGHMTTSYYPNKTDKPPSYLHDAMLEVIWK